MTIITKQVTLNSKLYPWQVERNKYAIIHALIYDSDMTNTYGIGSKEY